MSALIFKLAPEVLTLIFDHLVRCVGIRPSVRLRPVCRTFEQYIMDAVYALPTFESLEDDGPDHLTWDIKMHKSMVANLIRAKVKKKPDQRALTREILQTVTFVMATLDQPSEEAYTDALVRMAAKHLPLHEVIRGLSTHPDLPETGSSLLENALAAALFLDLPSDVETLLNQGAKAQSSTKWFGNALTVAGCHARAQSFFSVLKTALATDDPLRKSVIASRLIMAFERGAAQGRADVFCARLWADMDEMFAQHPAHTFFYPALMSGTLASNDDVVLAVFELFTLRDTNPLTEFVDEFWVELLTVAASNGSTSTVWLILNKTATTDCKGSLELPLEVACRNSHTPIVRALIARRSQHNLSSYAGAMYWAARGAHYNVLSFLFQNLAQADVTCIEDALCGASVRGTSGFMAVLKVAADLTPVRASVEVNGMTFAQLIDKMSQVDASNDSTPGRDLSDEQGSSPETAEDDIFLSLMSVEQLQIMRACSQGSCLAVPRILSQSEANLADREDTYIAGGFSECIRYRQPGILQYLCEKIPNCNYFSAEAIRDVRSPAIFQVLFDHGWTAEADSSRLRVPILGRMVLSDELIRWFLDHGADPNVKGDWDITPFSAAVQGGSLSTLHLLLQHGGDTRRGQLLHFAMQRSAPDQLAVIDMLIACGAPINARMFENDPESWLYNRSGGMGTPLHKAAELGNLEVVSYLIERGADCSILDSVGRTALDLAKAEAHDDVTEVLEGMITTRHSDSV